MIRVFHLRTLVKAGAYGIQEAACIFVSKLNGDYYNVVGLPICEVYVRLERLRLR